MTLPPNVFFDMQGEFIEFVEGERLVARFPNQARYMNPFGMMQGGIVTAAIDNTVSPLSYVSGPACITKDIHTFYKRPIQSVDCYIEVVATIQQRTMKGITLHADVFNPKGKLVANGVANCVYFRTSRFP